MILCYNKLIVTGRCILLSIALLLCHAVSAEQTAVGSDNVGPRMQEQMLSVQRDSIATLLKKIDVLSRQKNSHINSLYYTLLTVVILGLIYAFLRYLNVRRLQTAREKSNLARELVEVQNTLLILQRDLELEKQESGKLKSLVQYNAKSLTANTLNIIQKNQLLDDIKNKIEQLRKASVDEVPSRLNGLMNVVNFAVNIDRDWENFRTYFEQVHTGFFNELKAQYPDLNSSDLKLCALIKLNLDSKQMATVLDISPESVKVARSRLRKKIGMEPGENLSALIAGF